MPLLCPCATLGAWRTSIQINCWGKKEMVCPLSMKAPTSPVPGIEQLRTVFSGALIVPGDAEYDAARAVWNGMIDKYPALIARCTCTADVVAAVNFAREQQLVDRRARRRP